MRYLLLSLALMGVLLVSLTGFRGGMSRKPPIEIFPDMDRQPKLRPQQPNSFFANARSSQLPVTNTVARGDRFQDVPAHTGMTTGTTNFVGASPYPVTPALLARGQQRFQITCLPCHGPLADGNGITKKFGMAVVANLHDPRIVQMTDGEIFYVITHGRNLMGSYAGSISIDDRWAIIAYLRALQLSRLGFTEDVPEALRAGLK